MERNEILDTIINRRSIRKYTETEIDDNIINSILEAGRWAPSGLNNQPWKFLIIKNNEIKEKLSKLTKYRKIVSASNICISVFYDVEAGYNRDKDILSIGACIQNMLLAAESFSLGAVWLGEILNKKEDVNKLLNINDNYELLAVIAMGYPDESPAKDRKDLKSLIIKTL